MKLVQYNGLLSALWTLKDWCFSTRASVATVMSTHPCVSICLWVKCMLTRLLPLWPMWHYTYSQVGMVVADGFAPF